MPPLLDKVHAGTLLIFTSLLIGLCISMFMCALE
uniref:Uncharacterized protein n=1 Tax=Arundo donax TaxID=35708 RepID=A0A0A8ZVR8_ARUDO